MSVANRHEIGRSDGTLDFAHDLLQRLRLLDVTWSTSSVYFVRWERGVIDRCWTLGDRTAWKQECRAAPIARWMNEYVWQLPPALWRLYTDVRTDYLVVAWHGDTHTGTACRQDKRLRVSVNLRHNYTVTAVQGTDLSAAVCPTLAWRCGCVITPEQHYCRRHVMEYDTHMCCKFTRTPVIVISESGGG